VITSLPPEESKRVDMQDILSFHQITRLNPALAMLILFLFPSVSAEPQLSAGGPIPGVNLVQRLKAHVPLDAPFVDENGKSVKIGDYCKEKPVILNLIFYQCPGICSIELDSMVDCFKKMTLDAGKDFEVITISINPREGPNLAIDKKEAYMQMYGRPSAKNGWHFLVGQEVNIRRVADSIGYSYKYNPNSPNAMGMFAHPAGIILLTPKGIVSRYFFGTKYYPKDVSLALVEASENRIGSLVEKFVIVSCLYQYNPYTGRYGVVISRLIQISGFMTVFVLATFMTVMFARDRKKAREELKSEPKGENPL
jgi:protein SCO1/2